MTRTPFIYETARNNILNPDGSTPIAATSDFAAGDLADVPAVNGDQSVANNATARYSVAPLPAGATTAWTVTPATRTIADPPGTDDSWLEVTFTAADTYTVQCVITLAGDADSPKTISSTVVVS